MSEMPIEETLSALRPLHRPEKTWETILSICKQSIPSPLWDNLPKLDFQKDIDIARGWITDELKKLGKVRVVHLAIDTTDMEDGDGQNISIMGCEDWDPSIESTMVFEKELTYGSGYLIEGLIELHQCYSSFFEEEEFMYFDYIIPLSYTGIILGNAIREIRVDRQILFLWGYNSGDIFLLGQKLPNDFIPLFKLETVE